MANLQLIKKAATNGAKIKHKYRNEFGQTCIIGSMIEATGKNVRDLIPEEENEEFIFSRDVEEAREFLIEFYEIEEETLSILQEINDKFERIKDRRKVLLEQIELWEDGCPLDKMGESIMREHFSY